MYQLSQAIIGPLATFFLTEKWALKPLDSHGQSCPKLTMNGTTDHHRGRSFEINHGFGRPQGHATLEDPHLCCILSQLSTLKHQESRVAACALQLVLIDHQSH